MVEIVVLASGRVAGQTGLVIVQVSVHPVVVIVRFRVLVASRALKHRVVLWISMAVEAVVPFPLVCSAVDREIKVIVVLETGWHPSWIQRVALLAIRAETGCRVIRYGSTFEIILVALDTLRGQAGIICTRVTSLAILQIVPAFKREEVVIDLVRLPSGLGHAVALRAIH